MTPSSSLSEPSPFTQQWCNVEHGQPKHWLLPAYHLAWFSRACPEPEPDGSPRVNEDSAAALLLEDGSGFVAVADGMGGHSGGAQASATAIEALLESVLTSVAEGRLVRTGIITGFEEANTRVQKVAPGAGTTLAVAELGQGFIRPYHCGDSIVLQTGNRGKLKLLTTSHSPVAMAVEAGFLNEEEAMHHPERHVISNAIGTPEMRIEIGSAVAFGGRDTLLLSTDGLTDNLSIDEIIELIRRGPLKSALGKLANLCGDRMRGVEGLPSKPDDMTVVAVRCRSKRSGPPSSPES